MTLSDAFSVVCAFGFAVWLLLGIVKRCQNALKKLRGIFPNSIDFAVRDVPLSNEQWKRFCALAHARGISQKRLLADMIVFYFYEKVE
jgi:hypothetical protein